MPVAAIPLTESTAAATIRIQLRSRRFIEVIGVIRKSASRWAL